MQGKIFEESLEKVETSSLIFIRRFMFSNLTKKFDDFSFLTIAFDIDDVFKEIEEEYGVSSYGKTKYSKNEMFWIGYIYRALSIIYNLSSKQVFNLFNAKEIVKYYNIYHTYDVKKACEKMMENINYIKEDINKKVYNLIKKNRKRKELENLVGKEVTVHFKKGSQEYPFKYGYIKNMYGEIQDVYVLGLNEELEKYNGKVATVLENVSFGEDKLVVVPLNETYSKTEIKKMIKLEKIR